MNQDQTVIPLFSAPPADAPNRQANPERAMAILCIFIFYRGLRSCVLYESNAFILGIEGLHETDVTGTLIRIAALFSMGFEA